MVLDYSCDSDNTLSCKIKGIEFQTNLQNSCAHLQTYNFRNVSERFSGCFEAFPDLFGSFSHHFFASFRYRRRRDFFFRHHPRSIDQENFSSSQTPHLNRVDGINEVGHPCETTDDMFECVPPTMFIRAVFISCGQRIPPMLKIVASY